MAAPRAGKRRPAGKDQPPVATGLNPGRLEAQLTKRGVALRHDGGIDQIRQRFPQPVVRLLAAAPLTWVVHERFADGSISATPELPEPLQSTVRLLLETLADERRTEWERRQFSRAFPDPRTGRSQHTKRSVKNAEAEKGWSAYRKLTTTEIADDVDDELLLVLVRAFQRQPVRPLIAEAFDRLSDQRLARFARGHTGLPRPMPDRLLRLVPPPEDQPRKAFPRVDSAAERQQHLRDLQRSRVEVRPDPVVDARKRIGPVQNYGDDT